ncbi:LysE family translocator [Pelagibius marinus]|uniref:LysE family translocator n=1 Tax=Pelagibius marinus TaxID=2762760 RepID=UPI001872F09E|nr:LysE family translocator [Pelagibius marinus]
MTFPLTSDLLLALAGFAFVTSVSPGPGNFLLLASGANFGFRRTLPLVLGISAGFLTMVFLVGMGLGPLLQRFPAVYGALKIACIAYVLWLAWKIATSSPKLGEAEESAARPFGFFQAALLQWLNPKAWAVALIVTVSYAAPAPGAATADTAASLLLVIFFFALVNLPSISLWAASGMALRRLLNEPRRLRRFNLVMALLLVLSMAPVVLTLSG